VPTHEETRRFQRDYAALSADEKAAFKRAVVKFIEDLPSRKFRVGLRVKSIEGASGVFEMSWAGDGRATFEFGEELRPGEPHVVWRRVGTHRVFSSP
jgi:hypothetical protein